MRARVNDVLVGENSESEKAESRAYEYGGKVKAVKRCTTFGHYFGCV